MKEWLYKCDQFFMLDGTPAESKVRLASIHLDGIALQWHLNYMRNKFDIYPPWQQYVTDVTMRFGEIYDDPLSSLIQVKQSGTIQDYVDEFELALTQVSLLPEHSLSIFLTSLEYSTQMHVRMFNPNSIAHAANLAKLYEASRVSVSKVNNRTDYSIVRPANLNPKPLLTNTYATPNQNQKPVFNKIPRTFSAAEMAERRAKGLCMFCDELFTPGHQLKHKRSQLLVMELDEEDQDVDNATEKEEDVGIISSEGIATETPQLSLNAMTGIPGYQTMRVTGRHDKKFHSKNIKAHNSKNTHNFLDLEVAKRLGCKLEKITPMTVTAGEGTRLEAPYLCKGFNWQLQQISFTADVIVLPLGCCDLILGIPWLKSLGPILWDFTKLQMEFLIKGRKVLLRGAKPSKVKLINNKSLSQAIQHGAQMCFLYMEPPNQHLEMPSCQLHTSVESLQQDIVDNIVEEMLQQGLIQHSNNPFASPVVLVRKKNGIPLAVLEGC
uniref:Retrotransposon gag domain-containing protein n=1 Tax=Cajanus cajan TaxID=3821 RepID=A0A151QRJ7_CAJCA|nr:hypothetical protein KK1_046280 [Cajanus cajan]